MKKRRLLIQPSFSLELLSRLELPNLILTKDALYRLSYNSILCSICHVQTHKILTGSNICYYNTNSPNMQVLFS